ncbi:MAG: RAD55 family ATPase [Candidatus Bathycorpusculaceae bacterium]
MNKNLNYTPPITQIIEPTRILSLKGFDETLNKSFSKGCIIVRSKTSSRKFLQEREIIFPNFLKPLVKEGFPKGSNISVIGPPGVGKTIFCENLASSFLNNGGSCLYVTLDRAPEDIRNDFQEMGINTLEVENRKRWVFVDGFSWLIGKSKEDYFIENLANLTELSIRISSAAYNFTHPILMILDSVSPLTVYNPEHVVVKFLQLLLARIKSWKGIGVYVIQEGVHTSEFCNTIGYLVDGIFDMKMEEEKERITRYFRIRSLKFASHETKWIPFVIQARRKFKLTHKHEGS